MNAPTIWDTAPPAAERPRARRSIDERYRDWRATDDGRTVFGEVLNRAIRLRAGGWTHYSVRALVEAIRYDRDVRIGPSADGSGFKINDHYTSRIARDIAESVAVLRDFFETRELRA